MEILSEFDEYLAALKKVNLNEEVMPFVRGKLLTENLDSYSKIQKLLDCNAFESCHRWLYELDIENLDESEATRVANLYQLGVDRGFIEPEDNSTEDAELEQPAEQIPQPNPVPVQNVPQAPQAAYTAMYSATNPSGQIKTGEAYSNSISPAAAKADILSKLEKAGYQNITILAIEIGDPDIKGCNNTYCKQSDYVEPEIPDYANEADDNDPASHLMDPIGIKASTANLKGNNEVEMKVVEKDNTEDEPQPEKTAGKEVTTGNNDSDDTNSDVKSDDSDAKSDDSEDKDTKKKEEKAEEPDEKLKDEKPTADKDSKDLSPADKSNLKDSYKKAFKAAMLKCNFDDKSFDDLTLDEKVEFFTEMSKAWKGKADPVKFMSDKELESLEKIVVKK